MRGHITGKSPFAALVLVITLFVLLAAHALAQTPPSSTVAPPPVPAAATTAVKPSVKGVITGQGVNVRMGAGREYPVFFSAPLNYEVDVISQQGEWYEILFPIKGFSWITREYFQKIDEKTGIVTGNNVSVRAGPGTQYDRLYVVPNGYKFEVLGTDPRGDWYKVANPPGQTAWVLAPYVRLSGPLPAAAVVSPATAVPATTVDTVAPSTAVIPPASTVVPPVAPETSVAPEPPVEQPPVDAGSGPDPYAQKIAENDALFDAEVKKENPAEWDLAPIGQAYADIADKADAVAVRTLAKQRLAQLKYYTAFQDRVKQIGRIDDELAARLNDLERRRAEQITAIPETVEAPYTATGVVQKFYLKGIAGATHKLVAGDTILYLLKSEVVDLSAAEGKRCGVRGKILSSSAVNVRVIAVESLKALPQPGE